MSLDLCSTFSTQRFDPMLKLQRSPISAGSRSPSSLVSPGQSALAIKVPSNDVSNLSHVLPSVSPNLSSFRWPEGYSTGISNAVVTDFSHDLLSCNASATSFTLSMGERSTLVDEQRCGGTPGMEQPLVQSLVSAEQVDAHIPPIIPMGSRILESSEGQDSDDSVRGQIRLVSSSRVTEATAPTIRLRSISEPPPLSRHFCQVPPEWDSDYDGDTDTTREDEPENDVCPDYRDANVSSIPIPSPTLIAHSIPFALTSSLPPSLSTTSPCQSRSPISTTRAAVLSSIYEEDSAAIESTHRQQASFNLKSPGSLLPANAISPLEDIPTVSSASSVVDCYARWPFSPQRKRTGSGDSRCEHNGGVIRELKAQAEEETRTSHMHDCQTHEERLPLRPLSSVPGCCMPRIAARQMCSGTKRSAQKVLSAILPCIPVSTGETRWGDKKSKEMVQLEGARATGATIPARDYHSTKQGAGYRRKRIAKKKSSTALLQVKVYREVNRVVDYRSS